MALKNRRREGRPSAKDEDRTIQLSEWAYARFLETLDRPASEPTELMEQAAKARHLRHLG